MPPRYNPVQRVPVQARRRAPRLPLQLWWGGGEVADVVAATEHAGQQMVGNPRVVGAWPLAADVAAGGGSTDLGGGAGVTARAFGWLGVFGAAVRAGRVVHDTAAAGEAAAFQDRHS